MGRLAIAGTKDLMAQWAPKLAALMAGDWVQVNDDTKVRLLDQINIDITGDNGKTTIRFLTPLPLEAEKSWGPFSKNFKGSIEGVYEISDVGAALELLGLPFGQNHQLLQWIE